jgi:hypothetical protein
MTASLVVLLFASAFGSPGQANSLGAPGCGPADVQFDVKTDNGKHATPAPDRGKVLIIFMQDDAEFDSTPRPTTRFGMDGAWVGATHANSYFYVSVAPGEHHLCASWQSGISLNTSALPTAASHFTAEAGKTYYFLARDYARSDHSVFLDSGGFFAEVTLEPVDTDEAQVLMNSFAFSSSHAKK